MIIDEIIDLSDHIMLDQIVEDMVEFDFILGAKKPLEDLKQKITPFELTSQRPLLLLAGNRLEVGQDKLGDSY